MKTLKTEKWGLCSFIQSFIGRIKEKNHEAQITNILIDSNTPRHSKLKVRATQTLTRAPSLREDKTSTSETCGSLASETRFTWRPHFNMLICVAVLHGNPFLTQTNSHVSENHNYDIPSHFYETKSHTT